MTLHRGWRWQQQQHSNKHDPSLASAAAAAAPVSPLAALTATQWRHDQQQQQQYSTMKETEIETHTTGPVRCRLLRRALIIAVHAAPPRALRKANQVIAILPIRAAGVAAARAFTQCRRRDENHGLIAAVALGIRLRKVAKSGLVARLCVGRNFAELKPPVRIERDCEAGGSDAYCS